MKRLVAPYMWPLFAALIAALIGACGYVYVQAQWLAEAEAERDAAVAYIQSRRETDDALANVPDDPDAILDGLLECAAGGSCFGNP